MWDRDHWRSGMPVATAERLAVDGGEPLRARPWPAWPIWDEEDLAAVTGVIESGKWFNGPKNKEFAEYFAALDLWNNDNEDTPDVWEVLFKRGHDLKMSRLTAAMLGVNAHINHDLSLALIGTWNETGAPVGDEIHPDYLLVNQIFFDSNVPRQHVREESLCKRGLCVQ